MDISILRITRERLTTLGLAQIPPAAVEILTAKLAAQLRIQASKVITPRAVARAILAAATVSKQISQPALNLPLNLSPMV